MPTERDMLKLIGMQLQELIYVLSLLNGKLQQQQYIDPDYASILTARVAKMHETTVNLLKRRQ